MAQEEPSLNYEAVCKLVGQLYLESRSDIENLSRKLLKAESDRDNALRLLQGASHGPGQS